MPKYLIRRDVPGIASMTPDQLHDPAAKSNGVLAEMGNGIQWVQSYVAEDELVCVYNAEGPDRIREHARRGAFPCNGINQVVGIIDPVTGEG